jgi:hypothetical protein
MATKTTPKPAQFLLYGCREKKMQFGVYSDMMKIKTHENCKEFK